MEMYVCVYTHTHIYKYIYIYIYTAVYIYRDYRRVLLSITPTLTPQRVGHQVQEWDTAGGTRGITRLKLGCPATPAWRKRFQVAEPRRETGGKSPSDEERRSTDENDKCDEVSN